MGAPRPDHGCRDRRNRSSLQPGCRAVNQSSGVRVRIAPSPTGSFHVGNARSALFNWLFARHNDGVFLVRIDDTDRERSLPQYEEDILTGLRWLGLDWDEGVEVGGPHGTYRQSDRADRYLDAVGQLIDSGAAYHDNRTAEELDELRERARAESRHPGFYIRRPDVVVDEGVVRLAINQDEDVVFDDVVRGEMRFGADAVDDFVILRSDGSPTYHLASTVDDIDYEISHVVRGEDLLSSSPKHILLTRALGAQPPIYAHLPLLFGDDGKKLSKRHGDTALRSYREQGYLPDAMFNHLALLGWSPGENQTIVERATAVERFSLEKVSKNPAVFDIAKLDHINGEYMRAMDHDEFLQLVRPLVDTDETGWKRFVALSPEIQERTNRIPEAVEQAAFLFTDEISFDEKSWSKVMMEGTAAVLKTVADRLETLEEWTTEPIEASLRGVLETLELGPRKVFQPVRVAITGSSVSPPLFESLAALGRDESLRRIRAAAARLG
ncbi:MAG: glutamate--tRNA ligase [Acidimicrobiia bacterium]|nr:glutamate--tRNA ligase [Acidimicrobiia bacterium]